MKTFLLAMLPDSSSTNSRQKEGPPLGDDGGGVVVVVCGGKVGTSARMLSRDEQAKCSTHEVCGNQAAF